MDFRPSPIPEQLRRLFAGLLTWADRTGLATLPGYLPARLPPIGFHGTPEPAMNPQCMLVAGIVQLGYEMRYNGVRHWFAIIAGP